MPSDTPDIDPGHGRPATGQTDGGRSDGGQPGAAVEAARRALAEAEAALIAAAHRVATAQEALNRADVANVAPGAPVGGTLSVLRARRAADDGAFAGGRAPTDLPARPSVWRYAAQRSGNEPTGNGSGRRS